MLIQAIIRIGLNPNEIIVLRKLVSVTMIIHTIAVLTKANGTEETVTAS